MTVSTSPANIKVLTIPAVPANFKLCLVILHPPESFASKPHAPYAGLRRPEIGPLFGTVTARLFGS